MKKKMTEEERKKNRKLSIYKCNNSPNRIAKMKNYYLDNKDEILVKSKNRYETNKDEILAKCKNRYETNKDEILAKCKNRYETNKDEILLKQKDYYLKNRDIKLIKGKEQRQRYITEWQLIIKNLGMNYSWQSGKSFNSFYDLDFHHLTNDKKYKMSIILRYKPKKELIDELKKCVPLTAEEHKLYHYGELELNLLFKPKNIILETYIKKIQRPISYHSKRNKEIRDEWNTIIKNLNMNYSWQSGKSLDCFFNLEFHHLNPINKKESIAVIFRKYPTEELIIELMKCVPLTIEEHRMQQGDNLELNLKYKPSYVNINYVYNLI